MTYQFRAVNKNDLWEMRFIAEADSRIPLEFDPNYQFETSSIDARLDYYHKLKDDDFFQVVAFEGKIIGFHIVGKIPYPPNFQVGNIVTLWIAPEFRSQGLAAQLKQQAEAWAQTQGLIFLQTNVHKNNTRMLEMNSQNGYDVAYLHLRKRLT